MLITLGSWAVSSPTGSSPDDNYHLASIWCGAGDRPGLCEIAPDGSEARVPWSTVASPCYYFQPSVTANCQKEVFGSDPNHLVTTEHVNSVAHYYSPVYYAILSVFASDHVSASVIAMRLVNSLIFVVITSVLFWVLPRRRRPLLVVSMAVTLLPWGVFLVTSVNPSGWAVLAGGTVWLAVLGFLESTGWRRVVLGVLAAVTALMGAGARSDMAVYAVIGMVAAVFLAMRGRGGRRFWLSVILPAVLSLACFGLFLSAQQVGLWQNGVAPGSGGTTRQGLDLLVHNLLNVPTLVFGSLGTWPLGWNDVTLPPVVWVGTLLVFGAAVFTGLATMNWRKAVVVCGAGIALVALPLYLLQRSLTEVGGLVHPRYMLPLLIMFVGFVLFPVGARWARVTPLQAWLVVAVLSAANAVSLYSNIRRYTLGGAPGVSLSAPGSWWWSSGVPQPSIVFACGSIAFAAALALLAVHLLAQQRMAPPRPHGSAAGDVSAAPAEAARARDSASGAGVSTPSASAF